MTKTKPLSFKDAVRFLTLWNSDFTNVQIQERLEWLGLEKCTTFLIAQIRSGLRSDMRFLKQVGLLRNRAPPYPSRIRRLRPPRKEQPVR